MSKTYLQRNPRSVLPNRIDLPLCVQRDIILERDTTYQENLRTLCQRMDSGKLDQSAYHRIQPSLAMAALRRAHVNLKESLKLLKA